MFIYSSALFVFKSRLALCSATCARNLSCWKGSHAKLVWSAAVVPGWAVAPPAPVWGLGLACQINANPGFPGENQLVLKMYKWMKSCWRACFCVNIHRFLKVTNPLYTYIYIYMYFIYMPCIYIHVPNTRVTRCNVYTTFWTLYRRPLTVKGTGGAC